MTFRFRNDVKKQYFYGWWPLYLRKGTCWKEAVFIFEISGVELVRNGHCHENPLQVDNAVWFLDSSVWLRSNIFTAGGPYISETVDAGRKRSSFLKSTGSNYSETGIAMKIHLT